MSMLKLCVVVKRYIYDANTRARNLTGRFSLYQSISIAIGQTLKLTLILAILPVAFFLPLLLFLLLRGYVHIALTKIFAPIVSLSIDSIWFDWDVRSAFIAFFSSFRFSLCVLDHCVWSRNLFLN